MKDKIFYFFETERGLWLKNGSRIKVTNNPSDASKMENKFEAELFCSGLVGSKVTEHIFVNKD